MGERIAIDHIFPVEPGNCRLNTTGARDWPQSDLGWMHPDHAIAVTEASKSCYTNGVHEPYPGAMEVGGGTIPSTHLEKAGVSPFDHMRNTRTKAGDKVPLMVLVRSNAGAGMTDFPADVVKEYIKLYYKAGVDVFRNFHSHNDPRQFKNVYEAVRDAGGHFQAAYSWAVFGDDPTVFNPKNVVNFFHELEEQGIKPDSFCLKCPSGVLTPIMARLITREMKKAFPNKPFGIHTHDQAGFAASSCLDGARAGANFVDTSPSTGGRSAQTAMPSLHQMMRDEGIDMGKHLGNPAITEPMRKVDELCNRIASLYQTAAYQPKIGERAASILAFQDPQKFRETVLAMNPTELGQLYRELQAMEPADFERFYEEVLAIRYAPHIDVLKHGMAGGQSGGAYDELKRHNMLDRLGELWQGMEKARSAAGATCPVTPAADRFYREAIRIMLGGDPNKNFHDDPVRGGFIQELTGEAGPTKVAIDPVKQRQALFERTVKRVGTLPEGPKAKLLADDGALLYQLVDHMKTAAQPVQDRARLKDIVKRIGELDAILQDAKTDKDYATYVRVLEEKIGESKSMAEKGITTLQGVIGSLKEERQTLEATLKGTRDITQDYEALQKSRDDTSDELYDSFLPKDSPLRAGLKKTGLNKDQIVELMKAAGVTTCVASDLMEPGMDKARQGLREFAAEKGLCLAMDAATRREEDLIWTMFGAVDAGKNYFLHRDDDTPFWKHPDPEIQKRRESVDTSKHRAYMWANMPSGVTAAQVDDSLQAAWADASGARDGRIGVIPGAEGGSMKIIFMPKERGDLSYARIVTQVINSLGGAISTPPRKPLSPKKPWSDRGGSEAGAGRS